ncbi:hypothetical protein P7K49_004764 [Saguinus oedipus]|uniref:Uncharacterized protein n=1 Tax=Saguinus oedipus TaxID=9490 RepID=A0ABQ9WBZ1_SAGOE|nr:hypothetical protein P7K49_004764 [Saguinus oedipus]
MRAGVATRGSRGGDGPRRGRPGGGSGRGSGLPPGLGRGSFGSGRAGRRSLTEVAAGGSEPYPRDGAMPCPRPLTPAAGASAPPPGARVGGNRSSPPSAAGSQRGARAAPLPCGSRALRPRPTGPRLRREGAARFTLLGARRRAGCAATGLRRRAGLPAPPPGRCGSHWGERADRDPRRPLHESGSIAPVFSGLEEEGWASKAAPAISLGTGELGGRGRCGSSPWAGAR